MPKLIINLKGGTGNQLFQVAAASSLSKIYERDCAFCIDNFVKDKKYKRRLEIEKILYSLGFSKNQKNKYNDAIYLDEYDIDHPIYFSKSSPLLFLENDIFLDGYFTNYRIHNYGVIRTIKTTIENLYKVESLQNLEYIAIHLRELHGSGSLKRNSKVDNINIDYYLEALNKISQINTFHEIKNAIVFCDIWESPEDSILLPQIKGILKKFNLKYINGDSYIKSPLQIINIFLNAKFSIISNSTLSWWGGYLGDGQVYSPVMNLWEPSLKIPDNWKQIYNNEILPRTHNKKLTFETSITNSKMINFKIYSYKRLLMVKIFRKISNRLYSISVLNLFRKFMKYIGFLPENSNKTFF